MRYQAGSYQMKPSSSVNSGEAQVGVRDNLLVHSFLDALLSPLYLQMDAYLSPATCLRVDGSQY